MQKRINKEGEWEIIIAIIITSITINVIIGVIMMIIRSSNKEGGVASKGLILTDRGHRSPNQPSMPLFFTVLFILISIPTLSAGKDKLAQVMMSVKLCVQLEDFKENVNSAFGSLRNDKELTDVTLAFEDDQPMEAHKVILAASSPFFEKILQQNKHPHPLIYLKGYQSRDFLSILDFFYYGEAQVYQEDLDSFLAIAEEIQLKGLTRQNSSDLTEEHEKPQILEQISVKKDSFKATARQPDVKPENKTSRANFPELTIPNQSITDLETHDESVKSMMEKGENMIPDGKQANGNPKYSKSYVCKVCGKEGKKDGVRSHIEKNHLRGFCIPCEICGSTFDSRMGLHHHKIKNHKY